jgi:hypothetical protein
MWPRCIYCDSRALALRFTSDEAINLVRSMGNDGNLKFVPINISRSNVSRSKSARYLRDRRALNVVRLGPFAGRSFRIFCAATISSAVVPAVPASWSVHCQDPRPSAPQD